MMRHRGSVMTPEIQELELELQLLKRKRQLLQHEQEMLIGGHQSSRQRQRDYFDPSPQRYNQQQNQDFNFSHLYDDRPGSGNRGRQFGQKRHATDPWDNNGPSKRFYGSQGKPKSSPGPRSYQGFGSNKRGGSNQQRSSSGYQPEPLKNADARPSFSDRNVSNRSTTFRGARRGSRPTKVTKPRTSAPPNKLNSYPTTERKRLIDETGIVAKDDSNILSADKPPTPTQLGRMELALGNILKDLRHNFTDEKYQELFQSDFFVKAMKQTLRDRIRSVMIGHPILNMKNIIDMYREKFSKETDQEIIDSAMEVANTTRREKRLAIKLVPAETPEAYFRINMGKLINVKLDEMFKKLEKLYADENGELQQIIDAHMPNEAIEADNNVKTGEDKYDPADAFQNADQPSDTTDDNVIVIEEGNDSEIADTSLSANEKKDGPTNDNETSTAAENEDKENKTETATVAENEDEKEEKTTEESNKTSPDEDMAEADAKFVKTWKLFNSKYLTNSFYERLIHKSLTFKLPRILPSYKENLIRILNIDQQYRSTKAAIIGKVTRDIGPKDLPRPGENYYVKIIARPGLPKRRLMTRFLDPFNPLTIKKHKTVHNLLFIRVPNKEDFEKILEASGTRIGNVTLTITVSDWKNRSQDSSQIDFTKDTEPTVNVANDSGDPPLMSNELENQITDLLTSIRKEESSIKGEIKTDSAENTAENIAAEVDSEPGQDKKEFEKCDDTANTNIETENEVKPKVEMEKNENGEEETKNETAKNEQVEATKVEEKKAASTPTRASTRLASNTPSSVTTRRASKLT